MKPKGPKSTVQVSNAKQPKSLLPTTRSKVPQTIYVDDAMRMTPSWRIALAQVIDPWGWHNLDASEIRSIHTKLAQYEAKTWNEILVKENKLNHRIECHKLCKDAREKLAELRLDDVEQLVSLHLGARERVWGILSHNVLDLLWWDPEHLVYPVFKRYT
jgi:hypothetical protein